MNRFVLRFLRDAPSACKEGMWPTRLWLSPYSNSMEGLVNEAHFARC